MSNRNRLFLATVLVALTACSSQPTPDEQIENTERAAMTPLKTRYPDVVMGFDFHGPSADVSVDLNAMMQMDDDVEDAMKAQSVKLWREAWLKAHPNQHAQLTVRILDFRGNVSWKGSTKA